MATSEQLLTLLKAHYEGDSERLKTVALQIAAHEAKIGHPILAQSIKELVMKQSSVNAVNRIKSVDNSLIVRRTSTNRMSDLIVSDNLSKQIENKNCVVKGNSDRFRRIFPKTPYSCGFAPILFCPGRGGLPPVAVQLPGFQPGLPSGAMYAKTDCSLLVFYAVLRGAMSAGFFIASTFHI